MFVSTIALKCYKLENQVTSDTIWNLKLTIFIIIITNEKTSRNQTLGAANCQNHKIRLIILCTWMISYSKKWTRIRHSNEIIRLYTRDVGMEFGMEKYAMLLMKSGKEKIT